MPRFVILMSIYLYFRRCTGTLPCFPYKPQWPPLFMSYAITLIHFCVRWERNYSRFLTVLQTVTCFNGVLIFCCTVCLSLINRILSNSRSCTDCLRTGLSYDASMTHLRLSETLICNCLFNFDKHKMINMFCTIARYDNR